MIFVKSGDCQKASINEFFDAVIIENSEDLSLEAFVVVKEMPNCVFPVGKVFTIPDAIIKVENYLRERLFIIH